MLGKRWAARGLLFPRPRLPPPGEFTALCLLRLELFMALGVSVAAAIPPSARLCCHGQGDPVIRVLTWDRRNLDSVQTSAAGQLCCQLTAVSSGRAPAPGGQPRSHPAPRLAPLFWDAVWNSSRLFFLPIFFPRLTACLQKRAIFTLLRFHRKHSF